MELFRNSDQMGMTPMPSNMTILVEQIACATLAWDRPISASREGTPAPIHNGFSEVVGRARLIQSTLHEQHSQTRYLLNTYIYIHYPYCWLVGNCEVSTHNGACTLVRIRMPYAPIWKLYFVEVLKLLPGTAIQSIKPAWLVKSL